jgi:hypothetical protein
MINKLRAILLHPRRVLTQKMIQGFGDYETKLRAGVIDRPNYGFCLYNAAKLAKRLGYTKISVIEFGVAGGNGLLSFEYHAAQVCKLIQIEIEIYGFDRAEGLPKPVDYRDLPYHWREGFYKMDVKALESRLTKSKLILGDISHTLNSFFENYNPAPIGAISFDLDFYSSTKSALAVLNANHKHLLPRIFCYFDDTIGSDISLYNDFTGQRLAINEFNQENENIKLGFPYDLTNTEGENYWWKNQIWIAHLFDHPHYNTFVSDTEQQLPLNLQSH